MFSYDCTEQYDHSMQGYDYLFRDNLSRMEPIGEWARPTALHAPSLIIEAPRSVVALRDKLPSFIGSDIGFYPRFYGRSSSSPLGHKLVFSCLSRCSMSRRGPDFGLLGLGGLDPDVVMATIFPRLGGQCGPPHCPPENMLQGV